MPLVLLKPIPESKYDYDELEEILAQYFRELIYIPLMKAFETKEDSRVLNSEESALEEAIRLGKVKFYRGEFKGKLNSKLTRELKKIGAKWDSDTKTFKILLRNLPLEIQSRIRLSEDVFSRKMARLESVFDNIKSDKIDELAQVKRFFDTKIFRTESAIDETLDGIGVPVKMTKTRREAIATEYTNNINLYIQKFTGEETVKLRNKIQKNVLSGDRYEDIIDNIQSSYGVSKSKAKFLARQETSLMMTSLKEEKYKEAGSEGYYWRCVHGTPAHPVRDMHFRLKDTFVRWDNPPVVNEKGDRKHAGRDYNCRCYAQPTVRF